MIREVFRTPRDDVGAYARGWQLSAFLGADRIAVGYWLDRHPGEWTFMLFLGPLQLSLWRPR